MLKQHHCPRIILIIIFFNAITGLVVTNMLHSSTLVERSLSPLSESVP